MTSFVLDFVVIRIPEDFFWNSYRQPARRLSEADFRIAKQSIGSRMTAAAVVLLGYIAVRLQEREADRVRAHWEKIDPRA